MDQVSKLSAMVDDTRIAGDLTSETYGPELLSQMAEIAQFKIKRGQAQDWARKLLYIVYDGDESSQQARLATSEVAEAVPELAETLAQVQLNPIEPASLDPAPTATACDPHSRPMERHECDHCQSLPAFPQEARCFRLVRTHCSHFLAVSYCWPKDDQGNPVETAQTYKYRREDGTMARVRPPDNVVDRAIAYARTLGLRQLWIDQVCLPQDDSLEQQLGIQGIDLVYQRAHGVVGLFESIIEEQRQLDAFRAVLYWRRTGQMIQDDRTATLLIELLNLLSLDQWNSRAWILQEAFAAGKKMMINVRTAPGVRFQDEMGLLRVPQHVPDAFIFVLDDLYALLGVCREFLDFMADEAAQAGQDWLRNFLQQQSKDAIEGLESIRPASSGGGSMRTWDLDGGRQFGIRETCNAAVALSYLRNRRSHPPEDRLAILANLCDYEIRLDTRQMYRFPSLATAFFALALMNGDLSLLNPDLYYTFIQRAPIHTYMWCPPFHSILWNINSREVQLGVFICPRLSEMYHLMDEGFKCPAILWNINERVDLSAVRAKWRDEWRSHLVTSLTIIRFPLETPEEYRSRRDVVNKYIDDHPDQMHEGFTDPFLRENIRIEKEFNINHLERELAINMIAQILADILLELHRLEHTSLANSIWHAIRRAELERDVLGNETADSNARELPDHVSDLINSPIFNDLRRAIQLDWDRRGSFFQVWLIQRVMRDGFLWAGRGAALGSQKTETGPTIAFEGGHQSPSPSASEDVHNEAQSEPMAHDTILRRAERNQLMLSMLRTGVSGEADAIQTSGSVFEMSRLKQADYAWDDSVRQQMVVFDVDGPALVATPLDRDLERLPHPKDRSMRVSWVVEHAPRSDLALDARIGTFQQSEEKMAKKNSSVATEIQVPTREPWVFNYNRYRVQAKVMGCWPLIENLPRGAYLFV